MNAFQKKVAKNTYKRQQQRNCKHAYEKRLARSGMHFIELCPKCGATRSYLHLSKILDPNKWHDERP